MGGSPEPREARSEDKLHEPPIQGGKHSRLDGLGSLATA
jgi:hypothetical protein